MSEALKKETGRESNSAKFDSESEKLLQIPEAAQAAKIPQEKESHRILNPRNELDTGVRRIDNHSYVYEFTVHKEYIKSVYSLLLWLNCLKQYKKNLILNQK